MGRWTIRGVHRWTSLAFAGVVAALFAALGLGAAPPQWAYLVPLAPLAVLMATGLWLFGQPYLRRRDRAAPSRPPLA